MDERVRERGRMVGIKEQVERTRKRESGPASVTYDSRFRKRLLREFDRLVPRVRTVPMLHFGKALSGTLIREIRHEYAALIPRVPYIGGKKNSLPWYLSRSASFLAT